jgi:hypothetical protein
MVVKVVASCNYVPGKQQDYLEWAKKAVPILTAPVELKKMTAWENWIGESPHRVVEFEFEDLMAYAKWRSREDVGKVIEEWHNISSNQDSKAYKLIYEKTK